MKNYNQFNRLLFSLFCLILITSCEKKKDPVVITLTVDVSELGDNRTNPGGCTLTANPATLVTDSSSLKNFTVKVKKDQEIIWEGTTDEGGIVNINRIAYLRGTDVFDTPVLNGVITAGREKVKGKPKRRTQGDNFYEYSIRFVVPGKGSYLIDPKIQVE